MSSRVVWGDYEIFLDEVLGRGGMGCVYRARQRSLGRYVAVKVLDFSNLADPSLARGFVERFQIEVRALARLNNPRIVTILQAGQDDGRFWFAMELLEGSTLEQRLERGGPVPEREARRVGAEVARALEAAHRAGIIHRDVKPANIFLLADGGVKLADFGLARSEALMRTRLTEAGAMTCTPAYAAPEQVEGRPMDHRGDIYSLGCVLYEMVTQRPPFLGDSAVETLMKHRTDRPPSSRLLNPATTQDYESVVARCLEKNPEDRWPSYNDLIEGLEAGLSASARTTAPLLAPQAPPARRWSRPGGLAAAAGAAAIAVLLAVVYSDAPPPASGTAAAAPELRPVPLDPPLPDVASQPPPVPAPSAPLARPAPYRPTDAEVAALGRILEAVRASTAPRRRYAFADALASFDAVADAEAVTPWLLDRAAAERARLRAALRAFPSGPPLRPGEPVTLVLRDGRTLAGRVTFPAPGLLQIGTERVAVDAVAPVSFPAGRDLQVRAAAGDAWGVLSSGASLEAAHLPGLVDQALEEVFMRAAEGDLETLRAFRVPSELRAEMEPLMGPRFAKLDEEREAVVLKGKGRLQELLLRRPGTYAAAVAAAGIRADFERSLPDAADLELVGAVPWGTWAIDTYHAPGGWARHDPARRAYVLSAPRDADRAWIKKEFQGARKGWRVRLRLEGEDAIAVLALSFSRWIEVGRRSAQLRESDDDGRVRVRAERRRDSVAAEVSVFPREGVVLAYLDGTLLHAVAEGAGGPLGPGLQIGAGGGAVLVESIRIIDRTR